MAWTPEGIALSSSGNLFVSDFDQGAIYEVAPSGTISTFATGLDEPLGLAFDTAGNLFASNGGNIEEFSPSGSASQFATVPNGTNGLVFDTQGDLFVTSGLRKVSEILPNGTVSTYGTGFPGDVVYITDPAAVASVPEPTTAMLLACSCVVLLGRTRRTKM